MDINKFLKDIVGKRARDVEEWPDHYRLRIILEGDGIPIGVDKYRITMLVKNSKIVMADVF